MEFEPRECGLEAAQLVIDAVAECACVVDEAGVVVAVNAAWRHYAAAERAESGNELGAGRSSAFVAEERESASPCIQCVRQIVRLWSPQARETAGGCRCRARGDERRFGGRAVRMNLDGRAHFIVFQQDIAAGDTADARLRASNAQLERQLALRDERMRRLDAEVEAFNYSVSHDLQGPARRARHFCALISEDRESVLSPRAMHCLERVEANAEHMLQNIQGLLALSRVERHELVRSRCNLTAIAKDVAESLQAEGGYQRIGFTVSPDLRAHADPQLIRILFDHLLDNAMKFTGRALNPAIRVAATESAHGTAFCVRDNGVGFDMKHADRLFRPFQRLHREEEFAGVGMGLNIVHRIVCRHGGEVWAEAVPGEGASFYFTLGPEQPRAGASAESDAIGQKPAALAP